MEIRKIDIVVDKTGQKEELTKTLSTLFATRAGSQPADRDFGISWACLDESPEVAESMFYLEAEEKVERYEPRVQIEDIQFHHKNGAMSVVLFFKGKDVDGWPTI